MHVCVHLAEQLVGVSVELSVQIQHAADEIVELGVAAGAGSTGAGRSKYCKWRSARDNADSL